MTADLSVLLDGVEGFLHPDEPAFLAALAAQVPAGRCIVEVGSYRGRSTIALASGARDGVFVYAVDPHEEHRAGGYDFGMADNQAFMTNVSRAGMGHKVIPVGLRSVRFWGAQGVPVALAFIDGDHEYVAALRDVEDAAYALVVGGILAIHDSGGTWDGPTRAANELGQMRAWAELKGCAYTRVFQKGRQ